MKYFNTNIPQKDFFCKLFFNNFFIYFIRELFFFSHSCPLVFIRSSVNMTLSS